MRRNDSSAWLDRQREQWREWLGWLILVCYVAILYGMASVFWHVQKLFLFIGIFVVLPFLLNIVFKFLHRGEE